MIKFIKSMKWFIIPNWYRYVLVVFFGLALDFANLVPAMIIANLTRGIEQQTLTTNILIYNILLPFVGTMFGIYILATTKRFCQNRLTTTLYFALHRRYMSSILSQDATFFERYQAGDLLTRALGDINTVKFSGGNRLLNIFVEIMGVIFTFIAMTFIDPLLATFAFLPLTLIFVSNIYLKQKVKENWKLVREKHSLMGNKLLESVTNVRTIRAFSKEKEDYESNIEYSTVAYEVEKKNLKINVIFQPLFQFIVAISTIITYAVGAYFYKIHRITEIALLIQFIMYLNMFQNPLTMIGNMINNFYQSLISAQRLNEVYDSKSDINCGTETLDKVDTIEFRDFKFHYLNDDFDVLDHINLKINRGETIGIVGRTASGKSSLIRQLVRQIPTEDGKIFINGKPIEVYKKEDIRKHISYVPQEHILFSKSVYQNIKIGKKDATDEEIENVVETAALKDELQSLRLGGDTIVGEYGVTLSGGEKQRVAIARAFLKDSDVLILDDSLSALDGKTEKKITSNIKKYRKNKTNIIVAHRLSCLSFADKIIVLEHGKIVESGNHNELMNLKGWYYDQYNAQMMNGGDLDE